MSEPSEDVNSNLVVSILLSIQLFAAARPETPKREHQRDGLKGKLEHRYSSIPRLLLAALEILKEAPKTLENYEKSRFFHPFPVLFNKIVSLHRRNCGDNEPET